MVKGYKVTYIHTNWPAMVQVENRRTILIKKKNQDLASLCIETSIKLWFMETFQ